MAFLFGRNRQRQPAELARTIRDLLTRLNDASHDTKVEDDLAKQLAHMKLILQGTQEADTHPDQVKQLVDAVLQEDLLYELARSIPSLPFEARKDSQTIFSHILRFKPGDWTSGDPPVISYIVNKRPEVLIELCRGYQNNKSAMPCGTILREALKHEAVAAIILYDQSKEQEPATRLSEIHADDKQTGEGLFWNFLQWINQGSFEVSADAFTTFREILTRHKSLVAGFLSTNFDLFFDRYNSILVLSDSYVTKRQSIKLLGELLLDRANYNVMTTYVDSGDHLKLCMNLLKDDRKMVQYEGFHIFKVFVANPNKSAAVQRILINNRDRLLNFLPKFLEDRTDDDQFTDEKSFLVRQIENLPPKSVEPEPTITMTDRQTIPVGEYLFRRLREIGIRHVLGVPGDFNLNLLDHIYNVPDMRWVGACNELNAAYAADGYARTKGIPGAVVTTYGVGELSALNGIVGAYSEYVPVIHIVGNTPRDMQKNHTKIHHTLWHDKWDHTTYQKMVEPVQSASAFINNESKAAAEIDRVLETAVKTRLPVYLFIPLDVQDSPIEASPLSKPLDLKVTNNGRETEEDEVVSEIIRLLSQAANPGVIVDMLMQRHGLTEQTRQLVELINLPFYTTPMGKSTVNESDPRFVGLYNGLVSSHPDLKQQVENHDIILHLGPFPVSANTGGFSSQVSAERLIKLHPAYCSIGAKVWDGLDFRPVVDKLIAKLRSEPIPRKNNIVSLKPAEVQLDDSSSDPVDHARFWARLSKYLRPDDCVIAEVGTSQFGSQDLRLPDNTQYFSQLYYSCIGFSVPATLGVLLARREMGHKGRVILLVGDGSLHMTVQEIGTMVREGFTPTIFVVNNKGYTIERLIHGPMQQYNDISTLWDYQKMLGFFGAKDCRNYSAKTYKELGQVLNDSEFQKSDCIQVAEVFFDIMDSPWNLARLLQLKEERIAKARAAAAAMNG
ncbi:hypothetical protein FQN57_006201 [Myotisia sp. PD_48]|nr:hypothetical protein FQN57_006201 [Myotisia sp. PD_48]